MCKVRKFIAGTLAIAFIASYITVPDASAGQLEFDGVPVDITTADGEDLVILPGTGGNTQIGAGTANTNADTNDDLYVSGKLEVDGTIYADGGILAGASIVPAADSNHDLGTSAASWRNVYVETLYAGDIARIKDLPYSFPSIQGVPGTVLTNDGQGNLTWAPPGTPLPVVDTQTVVKGSVDQTKLLRFEVDGLTTGTTRVMTVPDRDGTLVVANTNGTVGIGTAVPEAGLHLAGPDGLGASLQLERIGNRKWLWQVGGSGSLTLNDLTAPGERMRVDATGNVGIGTTNPVSSLDVVRTDNSTNVLRIANLNGSAVQKFVVSDGTKTNWLIGSQLNVDNGFEISPSTAVGGNSFGDPPALVIKDSGNVGLGTIAPTQRLHLSSAASGGTMAQIDSYGATPTPAVIFRSARGTAATPTATQAEDVLGALGGRGYGTDAFADVSRVRMNFLASENWTNTAQGAYITFDTTQAGTTTRSERMRITQDGKVGIGTTTPASPLDVSGDIRISAGSGGQLVFADGTTMNSASVGAAGSVSNISDAVITGDSDANATGGVLLKTGSNTRVTVLNNGSVGIGSTNPGTTLDVGTNGGVNTGIRLKSSAGYAQFVMDAPSAQDNQIRFQTGGSDNAFVNYMANGSEFRIATQGAVPITLRTGNVEQVRVTADGKVGIGTTAPGEALDVSGSTQIYNRGSNPSNLTIRTGGAQGTTGFITITDGTYNLAGVDINHIVYGKGLRLATSLTQPEYVGLNNWGIFAASDRLIGFSSGAAAGGPIDTAFSRNAAGVIEVNNGTAGQSRDIKIRAINPSSGNVGIGTTSPAAKLDIADTWNAAGTTFSGLKVDVTNTASSTASRLVDIQTGGTSHFGVLGNGDVMLGDNSRFERGTNTLVIGSADTSGRLGNGSLMANGVLVFGTQPLGFSSAQNASSDLKVFRDAANTLGQRNGVNAQKFNIYNTYTDASNYERLGIGFSSNVATFDSSAAGTGTARNFNFTGGNVGVGSAVPEQKLTVNGVIKSTTGGIMFPDGTTQTTAGAAAGSAGWVDSGTSVHLTTDTDSVGIGTTAPGVKLDIAAGYDGYQLRLGYSPTYSWQIGRLADGRLLFNNGTVDNVTFYGNGDVSALGMVSSGGNVGVGVPIGYMTSRLTLKGAADGAGNLTSGIDFRGEGGIQSQAGIWSVGSSGYNGDLVFGTDGDGVNNNNVVERMRITKNGDVGIGTTNPTGGLLHVFNTTPTTGVTTVKIQAGAGQSTSDILQVTRNDGSTQPVNSFRVVPQGTQIAAVAPFFVSEAAGIMMENSRIRIGNSSKLAFIDNNNVFANTGDVAIQRSDVGVVEINNGTLGQYRDIRLRSLNPSGGNVGVGTASPGQLLHLSSNASTGTFAQIDSFDATAPTPAVIFRSARGTAALPTASQADDVLGALGARGYGTDAFSAASKARLNFHAAENWTNDAQGTYMTFDTTAAGGTTRAEQMRITAAGNVGIGTSVPGQKLTVAGTIESTSGGIKFPDGTTQTTAGTAPGASGWTDAGTSVHLATGTDNVGIGTNNPAYKLEVSGSFKSGTGTLIGTSSVGGTSLIVKSSTGDVNTPVFQIQKENGDPLMTMYSNSGATVFNGTYVRLDNTLEVGTKLKLDPQILSVKIDQAAPADSKLTVKAGDAIWQNRAGGDLDIMSGAGAGTGDGGAISFFTSKGIAASGVTNTQLKRMTILPDGNVGIGTTAPKGPLNISANADQIILQRPDAPQDEKLWIMRSDKAGAGRPSMFVIGLNSDAYDLSTVRGMEITRTANTINHVNFPNGNVGVGTVTPAYKLDVAGDVNVTGNFKVNGTNIVSGASSWTTSGNNIYNANSGNVGIGSATPGAKLDVVGNFQVKPVGSNDSMYMLLSSSDLTLQARNLQLLSDTGSLKFASTFNGERAYKFEAGTATFAQFRTNSAATYAWLDINSTTANNFSNPYFSINSNGGATGNVFIVNSAGNVGIGTTVPAAKLSVAGNMTVDTNGNSVLFSTNKPQYSAGLNIFIGGGGQNAVGQSGSQYVGDGNTALGKNTLLALTSGSFNTAIGMRALAANTTGSSNTAIGGDSQSTNTTGSGNITMGEDTLLQNTTGSYNTAIGWHALRANVTANNNTAIGSSALLQSTGADNTAVGNLAQRFNTTGTLNTAVGMQALFSNTTGSNNTAIGKDALYDLNITDLSGGNTAVGYNTGRGIVTGINNTILGANVTGLAAGLSNNIIIADGQGNQRINVGATGNVGIGSATPGYKLDVAGDVNVTGNFKINGTNIAQGGQWTTSGNNIYNANSGNVGIGTTNATSKISVYGNALLAPTSPSSTVENLLTLANDGMTANTGAAIQFTNSNAGSAIAKISSTVGGSYTDNRLMFDVQGSTRLTITNNGSVGINKAPGISGLDILSSSIAIPDTTTTGVNVEGNAAGSAGFLGFRTSLQNSTANTAGFIRSARTAGTTFIGLELGTETSHAVRFLTNGTSDSAERMRITSAGNVGIGTTSPAEKLHLSGLNSSLYATARVGTATVIGRENNNDAYFSSNFSSAGNYIIDGATSQYYLDDGYHSWLTGPSGIAGNAATLTERMRLTLAGNVGIGTTTPGELLHLSSAAANGTFMQLDSFSATPASALIFRTARGTAATPAAVQADDFIGAIGGRGYGATGFSAASKARINFLAAENWTDAAQGTYMTFDTTAAGGTTRSEQMRITAAGNVGIGSTAPETKLTVNGIIKSTTGGIMFPDGTTQTTAGVAAGASGWTDGGTSVYNTTLTDKIGIGTTTATAALTIKIDEGTAPAGVLLRGNSYDLVRADGSGSHTGRIAVLGGGAENIILTGTGVATIDDTINVGAYGTAITARDYNEGSQIINVQGSTGYIGVSLGYEQAHTGRISVKSAGTENIIFTGLGNGYFAGNVGIGSTTPGYKLDVAGDINVTGNFKVNGTNIVQGGQWTTTGNHISNANSGNVGIGTTAPGNVVSGLQGAAGGKHLEIYSPGSTTSGLLLRGNAAATGGLDLYSENGLGEVYIDSRFDDNNARMRFRMKTANATPLTAMIIRGNGNVGIGPNTNPGSALEVNGAGPILSVVDNNSAATPATGIRFMGQTATHWQISTGRSAGTGLEFISGVADSTVRMYFTQDGKLGIGTIAPASPLDVRTGLTAASGTARGSQFVQTLTAAANNDALTAVRIAPTFTNGSFTGVTNNGLIVESGNVGIGSSTPSGVLDVASAATGPFAVLNKFAADTNGFSLYFQKSRNAAVGSHTAVVSGDVLGGTVFRGSDGSGYINSAQMIAEVDGAVSSNIVPGRLKFMMTNPAGVATEAMRINSSGNVGIGTTGPSYRLSVRNDGAGIVNTMSLENRPTAANGTGSQLVFATNRTAGYVNVAGVTGMITDITDASYKGALTFNTANNGEPAERVRIDNAGNVGIGSSAPGYKLDVAGDVNVTGNFKINGTNIAQGGQWTTSGNNIYSANSGNVGIGDATPSDKLEVNGVVRIDSDNAIAGAGISLGDYQTGGYKWIQSFESQPLYINPLGNNVIFNRDGGNVGIGTTGPSAPLHLWTASNGLMRMETTTADTSNEIMMVTAHQNAAGDRLLANINFSAPSNASVNPGQAWQWKIGKVRLGNSYDSRLSFMFRERNASSDTEAMVVTSAGNVGIGTTSPTAGSKLDVNGVLSVPSGSASAPSLVGRLNTNTGLYWTDDGVGGLLHIAATGANVATFSRTGNVGIGSTTPGYKLDVAGDINLTGTLRVNGSPFSGSQWTSGTGLIYYNGGDVGIGTSAPAKDLEVLGTNDQYIRITGTGTSGNLLSELQLYTNNSTAIGTIGMDGNGNVLGISGLVVRTVTNHPIGFRTNNTEHMRITAGGNVGIGTTVPGGKLDVNGVLRLSGVGTSTVQTTDASGLYLDANTNAGMYLQSDGRFYFRGSAGTGYAERMRIEGNGNIGIGTTTPADIFHVSSNASAGSFMYLDSYSATPTPALIFRGARGTQASPTATQADDFIGAIGGRGYGATGFSSASKARINFLASENWTDAAQGTYMTFDTTASGGTTRSERMRIDPNGRVGIGTTNTGNVTLTVVPRSGSGDNSFYVRNDQNNNIFAASYDGSRYGFAEVHDNANNALIRLNTNGSTYFNGGNVGIGTASPTNRLEVAGNIKLTAGGLYFPDGSFMTTASGGASGQWTSAGAKIHYMAGNVGIGSNDPQDLLEIDGNHTASKNLRVSNAMLKFNRTGAGSLGRVFQNRYASGPAAADGMMISYGGEDDYINSRTSYAAAVAPAGIHMKDGAVNFVRAASGSSGAALTWLNTATFDANGNVGIGTTNPGAYNLNVAQGGLGVAGTIVDYQHANSVQLGSDAPAASNGVGFVGTGNNIPFAVMVNSGYKLYVLANGNVGIGTSAPGAYLHTAGDALLEASTSTAGQLILSGKTDANRRLVLGVDTSNDFAYIQSTRPGSGYRNLALNPNGGNVGIGTTAPRSLLHLQGTDKGTTNLYTGANLDVLVSDALAADKGGSITLGARVGSEGITGSASIKGAKSNATDNNYDGYLALYTTKQSIGSREWLRITADGNVGIGTTAPGTKLDVAGTDNNLGILRLRGSSGDIANISFFARSSGAAIDARNWQIATNYSADGMLQFIRSSSNSGNPIAEGVLNLTKDGNVGIGTTSPSNRLHVHSTNAAPLRLSTTSSSNYIPFDSEGLTKAYIGWDNGGQLMSGSDRSLVISSVSDGNQTSGNIDLVTKRGNNHFSALHVHYNGNVGIGSTTPAYTLDVAGAINATSVLVNGVAVGSGGTQWASGTGGAISYTGGSVGIGTTTPTNPNGFSAPVLNVKAGNASQGSAIYVGNTVDENSLILGQWGTTSYVWNRGNGPMLIATNGAERVRIDANGNVGVGGASSTSGWGGVYDPKLHIKAGTDAPVRMFIGDNTQSAYGMIAGGRPIATQDFSLLQITAHNLQNGSWQNSSGIWFEVDAGVGGGAADAPGQINFLTASDGSSSLTSRMMIRSNGNIGIGTTNPANPYNAGRVLHVDATTAESSIYLSRSNGGVGNMLGRIGFGINGTTPLATIEGGVDGAADAAALSFVTRPTTGALTERMRITSTGNVGIGTTSPGARFHALGTTAYVMRAEAPNNAGTLIEMVSTGGSQKSFALGTNFLYADTLSIMPSTTNSGSTYTTGALNIKADGNVGIGVPAHATYKMDVAGDVNITGQFRVNGTPISGSSSQWSNGASSSINYGAGNVGIGTTTPVQKLHVFSTTDAFVQAETSGADGQNAGLWLKGGASNANWFVGTNRSDLFGAADSIGFYKNSGTAGTKLVINNAGNVGIGTTAPSMKFDVKGSADFGGDQDNNRLRIGGNAPSGGAYLASLNSDLTFWPGNTAEKMRITTAGNVGIGTTAPGTMLHVYKNNGDAKVRIQNAEVGGGSWDLTSNGGSNQFLLVDQTPVVKFRVNAGNSGNTVLNEGGGNVGIGSMTPGYKLDVAGDVNITGTFRVNGTPIAGGGSTQWSNSAPHIYYNTGNVGIGTSAPGHGLHVKVNQNQVANFESPNGNTWIDVTSTDGAWSFGAMSGNKLGIYQRTGSTGYRFVIDNTGNVGIGTTSPAWGLDVQQSVSGSVNMRVKGTVGQHAGLLIDRGDAATDGNLIWYTGGTLDWRLQQKANDNGNLRLLSSSVDPIMYFQKTTGNVGVGSAAPGYKLDVAGDINVTGQFRVNGTPFTGSSQWTTATNDIYYNTGNVGIGTTAPAAPFHVVLPDDGSKNFIRLEGLRSVTGAHAARIEMTALNSPAAADKKNFHIINFTPNAAGGENYLMFRPVTDAGGAAASSGMTLTHSGNLGIGTTTPTEKLHVQVSDSGGLTEGLFLEEVANGDGGMRFVPSSDGAGGHISFGGRATSVLSAGEPTAMTSDHASRKPGSFGYLAASNAAARFYFMGSGAGTAQTTSELMTILNNGNVGIGTSAPVTPLHINSGNQAIRISALNDTTPAYIQFMTSASTGMGYVGAEGSVAGATFSGTLPYATFLSSGASGTALQLGTAGVVKMTVLSGGNVGIGTTAPGSLLDVNGALTLRNISAPAVAPSGQGRIYYDTATNKFRMSENGGAYVDLASGGSSQWSTGTNLIYYNGGNVGIGTLNPTYKLEVTGSGSFDGNNFVFNNDAQIWNRVMAGAGGGTAGSPIFTFLGDTNTGMFRPGNDVLAISTAGAERMRVDASGNVGIGTTTANTKLEVAGIARFTGDRAFSIGNDTGQNRAQISDTGFTRFAVLGTGNGYLPISAQALSIGGTYGGSAPPSNGAIIEGSVGIGTTNPTDKVTIAGGDMGFITGGNQTGIRNLTNSGGLEFNPGGTAGAVRVSSSAGGNQLFMATSGNVGVNTDVPNSRFQVAGSMSLPIVSKTAAYTATVADYTIVCNTTTAGFTISLPTAVGIAGRLYVIKKVDSSVNAVVVDPAGTETIDGNATFALNSRNEAVTVQSDGANWVVL